jgi:hypothetical protein
MRVGRSGIRVDNGMGSIQNLLIDRGYGGSYDEISNSHERVIFRRGETVTNDHFIGAAWLEMLVPDDRTFNCRLVM